jgi:hypothetical protein
VISLGIQVLGFATEAFGRDAFILGQGMCLLIQSYVLVDSKFRLAMCASVGLTVQSVDC